MKLNDIIVLDNSKQYTLLKETMKEGKKYYLAAEVSEDGSVNHNAIAILELIHEQDGNYVEIVEDEELIKELSEMFKDTFK